MARFVSVRRLAQAFCARPVSLEREVKDDDAIALARAREEGSSWE